MLLPVFWLLWVVTDGKHRFSTAKVLKAPLEPTLGIGWIVVILLVLVFGSTAGLVALIIWAEAQMPRAGLYVMTAGLPSILFVFSALMVYADDLFALGHVRVDRRAMRLRTREVNFELTLSEPFELNRLVCIEENRGWYWHVIDLEQAGRRISLQYYGGRHNSKISFDSTKSRRGMDLGNAGSAVMERLETAYRRLARK